MLDLFSLSHAVKPSAEVERIIRQNALFQAVAPRQTILEAGEASKGIYYILHGRTRHFLLNADGAERILYVLSDGCFFGETEYLLDMDTGIYAMAEEQTELSFIPRDKLAPLLQTSIEFSAALRQNMALKNRVLRDEIESLTFSSSKDRLLNLIYANTDTAFAFDGKWYQVKRNYTLQEIGTILGVSRVTISKLVNEFCNDGIIRIVNRQMQINIRQYNLMGAGQ